MSATSAGLLAMTLSFAVMVAVATWYVAPWLKLTDWTTGLTALLWVHAFRYVALQIFSAQQFGLAVSEVARNQIAYGDVVAALLAVSAITALRYAPRLAIPILWLFAVEAALDLTNSTVVGMREQLFASASDVTWLILTFYVPLLWVSLALLVWQLWRRRPKLTAP
jgi:hypothetical protein